MTIRQIIEKIDGKQLFVPAFQREYVWKRENAKALIASLIKTYPTGTLLTWETNNPPKLKGDEEYNPLMGAIKIILDGQQRITTLYMLMKGEIPPYYTEEEIINDIRNLYVNLESLELEYYKPKTMHKNPLWVSITEIFKKDIKPKHVIRTLENNEIDVSEELEDRIEDNFDKIKNIEDRQFPEQSIPISATINEAIDIFYIVNASGVNLTDAELALAQISGYWPEARDIFKRKLFELQDQGFVLKLDFIVYALLGCLYNMGSDMRKLHSPDNKDQLVKAWKQLCEKTLDYVFNIMKSYAFIDHTKEINSVYALVPIISFAFKKKKLSESDIKKAIKWFYYSQIRQRYVSQTPQKLDKDLKIISESSNPFDELLGIIESERKLDISPDEFVGTGVNHPLFSLMRWYFKSKNAICLGTGLSLRKNMGKTYELENDHIFAYGVLADNGYNFENRIKFALAQEITNRAILTQLENRTKSDEYAEVYLTKVKDNFPNALNLQSIPEDPKMWKVENYELFLQDRRKRLATELNNYLKNITTTVTDLAHLEIEDLIEMGENKHMEFKATLRYDLATMNVNKKLEDVILKAIAAFANGDGGMLIIGVRDDGEILGLENDYDSLEGTKDEFELHLRNLLNKAYGKKFAANYIDISFPIVKGKEICAIKINASHLPLYTLVVDKNGASSEKFYIRSGNSSQELAISEVSEFIIKRFDK